MGWIRRHPVNASWVAVVVIAGAGAASGLWYLQLAGGLLLARWGVLLARNQSGKADEFGRELPFVRSLPLAFGSGYGRTFGKFVTLIGAVIVFGALINATR
jgi:hypothetical protein